MAYSKIKRNLYFIVFVVLLVGFALGIAKIVVTMSDSAKESGHGPLLTVGPSDTTEVIHAQDTVDDNSESSEFEWWSHTIMINGKVFRYGCINEFYYEDGFLYNERPLVDDPTASLDSLSPTIYEIDMLGRRLQFDVTKNDCIDKIRNFNQPIRGFSRYDKTDVTHYGLSDKKTVFHLTIDYPNADIRQHSEICDWLIYTIGNICDCDSKAWKDVGRFTDIPSFGKFLIDDYFGGLQEAWEEDEKKDEFPAGDYDRRIDCRARVYNGRYVTYCVYLILYSSHRLGWDEYLISYDLVNHRPVTEDVLFKPDKIEQVYELYLDAISRYLGISDKPPVCDCDGCLNNDNYFGYDPALSLEGIMFHVGQWPVGQFPTIMTNVSVMVPYDKIRQYLTLQTLSLIYPEN